MSTEYAHKSNAQVNGSNASNPVPPQRRRKKRRISDEPIDEGLRGQKRMAFRFAQIFRGHFLHTPGRGWMEWTGSVWQECGEARAWNGVHTVCRWALRELEDLPSADRDALYADIRKCDSATNTTGVLRHAAAWPGIGRRDEDLNARADLFVVLNGTYDLMSGTFRQSDPEDLMTLSGGVIYDPDAECPLYDSLLETYQPDPTIRDFLHRLGGAAMEGRQNLQNLIVNYGQTGGNGKGTIQRAWMNVFRDYTHVLPIEALLRKRGNDQYRDEKAKLQGKRLVYLTEPSEGSRFDTGTVKSLTGGDAVTARSVYRSSVIFEPTWLLMLSTNNRVSTPLDGGMARRLSEIGWTYTVPEGKKRDDLDELLRAEGSGILNRLIAGWHAYRASGVGEPETVRKDTAAYLHSVDPVSQFLEECVEPASDSATPTSSLYTAYSRWCADNGERPKGIRQFTPDMEKRGYVRKKKSAGNVWEGVRLVPLVRGEDRSW